jgi:glycosyltransferase involved in cell wall biosynthesis
LTYRRPDDIAAALPQLVSQAASVTDSSTFCDIVVVDNDPEAGARELVCTFAAGADIPVHYLHEAEPGIANARNRALASAADVDVLVFVDDDERPSRQWLALLTGTYDKHRCAAVVGPVVSVFAAEPDPWIRAGRFFSRLRRPTGTAVTVAATNNLLLDLGQVRALGLQFDPEFGISGGSDTLFTRQLHRLGGRLIWCDEAVVLDAVPPNRATRSWVLRRAFRSGNGWSRTSLALSRGPQSRTVIRLRLTASGLVRVVAAAARLALGLAAQRQDQHARGARTLARGLGMLAGAWGYTYQEYRRSVAH